MALQDQVCVYYSVLYMYNESIHLYTINSLSDDPSS